MTMRKKSTVKSDGGAVEREPDALVVRLTAGPALLSALVGTGAAAGLKVPIVRSVMALHEFE